MRHAAFAVALAAVPTLCHAQAVAPGAEDLRHNLQTATEAVRIETPGAPPFRVEASFDTFDFQGKPEGSGTVVEEWLNVGTRRRTITFGGGTWTQVAHAGSVHSSGDGFQNSFMEEAVVNALLTPGPQPAEITGGKPQYKSMKVGTVPLDCTILTPIDVSENANPVEKVPTAYCLSQNPVLLRLVQQRYGLLTSYNHFAQLAGHFLPEAVTITSGAVTRATLKVTSFHTMPTLKESDFPLPATPDASQVNLHVADSVLKAGPITKVTPYYPAEDKQNHISGTVSLRAVIDKTGSIAHLEVINAPSATVAQSALEAVRQWKYRPYLLNGKPTSVDTIVTVNYAFGR